MPRQDRWEKQRGDKCDWVRVTFHNHEEAISQIKMREKKEESPRIDTRICICDVTFRIIYFSDYLLG